MSDAFWTVAAVPSMAAGGINSGVQGLPLPGHKDKPGVVAQQTADLAEAGAAAREERKQDEVEKREEEEDRE